MTANIVFMGTPDFALPPLQALCDARKEHDLNIVAVYTQPPRKAGRGHHLQPTPVARAAEQAGLPVFCPTSLKSQAEQDKFAALKPDLVVVVAYGLILPPEILAVPRLYCLNIHASLLPRWRGAAPIQRAIEAGDKQSGICIMQMEAGLDTGAVMMRDSMPIPDHMNAGMLHDRLAQMGGEMIVPAVRSCLDGTAIFTPQNHDLANYARKLDKSEAQIFWHEDAEILARKIRAFTPWPGAWVQLPQNGKRLKILEAKTIPIDDSKKNKQDGEILDSDFTVKCGGENSQKALRLIRVQEESRKPTDGASYLRGTGLLDY